MRKLIHKPQYAHFHARIPSLIHAHMLCMRVYLHVAFAHAGAYVRLYWLLVFHRCFRGSNLSVAVHGKFMIIIKSAFHVVLSLF